LGLEALRHSELQALLDEAVALTRRTLATDFTAVFEALPDDTLCPRASDGFPDASEVRALRIGRDGRSQAAYTRSTKATVISEDLAAETRFEVHPMLRALGVTSSITAPIHGHDRVYGVVAAHAIARRVYCEDDRNFLQAVANTLGSAMERHRVEEELHAKREQLQALSRRLIEAQEAERRALARELHDDFGQFLTAVRLHLQAARNANPKDAERSVDDAIHLVDQGIDQVRSLALDLRPSILDDLGLMAALRWLVKRQAQRGGFRVDVAGDVGGERLPAEIETCAFRLVQEALTNVARHASAQKVAIEVETGPRELRLLVRDDGKGFDIAAARARSALGAGLGLVSMQERATLVGGRLEIESRPGAGTTVRAHVPLGGTP
jgi:signal transduction histidine kinase